MASTKREQQNFFHLEPLEPMNMYLIFVRSHETNGLKLDSSLGTNQTSQLGQVDQALPPAHYFCLAP